MKAGPQELTPQTVFQRFIGTHTADVKRNPFNYVALAHFDSGVSRPMKQGELQQIVSGPLRLINMQRLPCAHHCFRSSSRSSARTSSLYSRGRSTRRHRFASRCGIPWPASAHAVHSADSLICTQRYISPVRDMRYITSFSGEEGLTSCTTFARSYSHRYTHAYDDPSVSPQARWDTARASGASSDDCYCSWTPASSRPRLLCAGVPKVCRSVRRDARRPGRQDRRRVARVDARTSARR